MAKNAGMLLITCSCGQRMKVPAEALGKTATCVKCGEHVEITAAAPAEQPEAAPAQTKQPAAAQQKPRAAAPADPGAGASQGQEVIEALKAKRLVTNEGIEEAKIVQRDIAQPLWRVLIAIGRISSKDFHDFMSTQKGLASIDLGNYNIPPDVTEVIPGDMARQGMFVPVDKLGKLLTLAMACPLDTHVIDQVKKETGLKVKRMLTTLEDLEVTLERCYPDKNGRQQDEDEATKQLRKTLEPLLSKSEAARRIFQLDFMPPSAEAAERLKSDAVEFNAIAEIIASDPTSAAIIMSMSNSAAYGFARKVDGIGMACAVLGPDNARGTIGSMPPEDYTARSDGFDYESFLRRAQFCSEAALRIANAANSESPYAAQVAGLLHHLGRLALIAVMPQSYNIVAKGLVGQKLARAESRIYGISAAEAGYILASKWNLPMVVADAIRYQRDPNQAGGAKEMASIMALAVYLADVNQANAPLKIDDSNPVLNSLGLKPDQVQEVFKGVQEKTLAAS